MKILAIETSCDETAISILNCEKENINILAHKINSQIDIHRPYGGVYPSIARREHALNIIPVLAQSLADAKIATSSLSLTEKMEEEIKKILERESELAINLINFLKENNKPDIDSIVVTEGPGLEPALWVGISFAKALSFAWDIPVIPVNHMEGHIVSAMVKYENETLAKIEEIEFPAIALLVSGGHTELIKINSIGNYDVIGRTRDDAVGEAFDKVARLLGFPYPGGPEISKLADEAERFEKNEDFKLPRPMLNSGDLDFSFSGIKTAVRYMIEKIPNITAEIKMQIAKEFEDAVVEVLVSKTKTAIENNNVQTLIVGGGVIANKKLRNALTQALPDTKVLIPDMKLTTDNATMIGIAGYLKIKRSTEPFSKDFKASGSLVLDKKL